MVRDLALGHGAVGGVVQSGFQHGQLVAELLMAALDNPNGRYQAVARYPSG